jgi:glyoxylase-like metal-dependent hydrolase (beta-lactamase superfamily II)
MKTKLLVLGACAAAIVAAQNQPVLREEAVKVSEHVWAIMGWPNIGIVVGSRAVLVVDTGLGPRNGATIARVVSKLAPGNRTLYLTTTHFHPEHAAGEGGFPRGHDPDPQCGAGKRNGIARQGDGGPVCRAVDGI